MSIYRKLGVSSRSQAVNRSLELALLKGDNPSHPIRGMEHAVQGGMLAWRQAEMYGPDGEISGDLTQAGDDRRRLRRRPGQARAGDCPHIVSGSQDLGP